MLQATQKEEQAIWECYRRLYKASTPSADFDELVENAPINESGQKQIDYNSYEIEYETCNQIIKDIIKEYKIQKWKRQLFNNTIILGCSPKFKNYEAKN